MPTRLTTYAAVLVLGGAMIGTTGLIAERYHQSGATLQHVTVVVSDFEQSRAFYTGILGLEELPAAWLSDKQAFLRFGEDLELHVGEVPGVEINPSAFNHFAFSTPDFDGFLTHLKENGVVYGRLGGGDDYSVFGRPDGVRQTFFQDPDGYWIEVNDYASGGAATAQGADEEALSFSADAALAWSPCPPLFPSGCEITVLHGVPGAPDADIFFRVPGGYEIPRHSHTSAERMVLISGALSVAYDGQDTVVLTPGMYAYGPARAPHEATCAEGDPCVLFIAFEEPIDALEE